jgi:hypothetical protein
LPNGRRARPRKDRQDAALADLIFSLCAPCDISHGFNTPPLQVCKPSVPQQLKSAILSSLPAICLRSQGLGSSSPSRAFTSQGREIPYSLHLPPLGRKELWRGFCPFPKGTAGVGGRPPRRQTRAAPPTRGFSNRLAENPLVIPQEQTAPYRDRRRFANGVGAGAAFRVDSADPANRH